MKSLLILFHWNTVSYFVIAHESYQRTALEALNKYREQHKEPPLQLNTKLSGMAERCAIYYTQQASLDHSCPHKGIKIGENLFGIDPSDKDVSDIKIGQLAADKWYSEGAYYHWNRPTTAPETEDFTQMMWKDSEQFGFGYAHTPTLAVAVALFKPNLDSKEVLSKEVLPNPETDATEA